MFVDSHCHLSFPSLRERIDEIVSAMAEAQVDRALCICTTLEEFPEVLALARRHSNLRASVGVHPDEADATEPTLQDLLDRAAEPGVVAIGETGLDYYRLEGRSVADMEWQRERFRIHIRAARSTGLPLVVHTRSASADTVAVLREEGGGEVRGVFHCFTETLEVARQALDLGFYVSFSGIITFRNAGELREVVRYVPLDRCLIETDSPYLAPVPHRGKTNLPAYVPWVARQVAELKGCSAEEIGRLTTENFDRLFEPQRVG